jgi:hypothetical protein
MTCHNDIEFEFELDKQLFCKLSESDQLLVIQSLSEKEKLQHLGLISMKDGKVYWNDQKKKD